MKNIIRTINITKLKNFTECLINDFNWFEYLCSGYTAKTAYSANMKVLEVLLDNAINQLCEYPVYYGFY